MQQVIQLSESQYELLSNDLAELIGKLDNPNKGVVQQLEAILSQVSSIDKSYIDQIEILHRNYTQLDSNLKENQSLKIATLFNDFVKDIENSIKKVDLKDVQEQHNSAISKALVSHLNEDINYKSMIDTITQFNKVNAIEIREQSENLINSFSKSLQLINKANQSFENIKEVSSKMQTYFYKTISWKTGLLSFLIGSFLTAAVTLYFLPHIAKSFGVNSFLNQKVYKDRIGDYIVYNKESMKMTKDSNNGNIKIYLNN